jgi:hypothetical protein
LSIALSIRVFFVLCLAGATYNHLVTLIDHGWQAYKEVPEGIKFYWNALTLFDPLAIILLVLKPRIGLLLLLVIMFSDVGINAAVVMVYGGVDARFVEQALFLLIVLLTMPIVWRESEPISAG